MGSLGVVEVKVGVEPGLGLPSVRVSLQVDLFVLHCPPQPLHKYVVSVPPFSVHADSNTIPLDKPGKGLAGELAPLVGVEDLRLSFAQRLLEGLEAEVDIQGVGQAPGHGGRGVWTVPDEKTLPALLALLGGYASGGSSFQTLAESLNAQGYRTNTGKPFSRSSVTTALNNPFYDGRITYHRNRRDEEVREGVHSVPDEVKELWRRCQDVRRSRRIMTQPSPDSRHHRTYPLMGVLVCDGCGQPFHGVTCRSHGGTFRRMFHSDHRCGMRPLSVGAPRLEREVGEQVLAHINLDDGWREAVLRALAWEGPQPDHTLEMKRVDTALANLRKQHLWGAISDDTFKEEFRELEHQRRAWTTPPPQTRTPDLVRAAVLLKDLPALWRHPGVTLEQRRELVREVFEEIRIREGALAAVKPRPSYTPLFGYTLWRGQVVGGVVSS